MKEKRLETIIDTLDERFAITHMFYSTAADQAYYNGMVQAVRILGYDVLVDEDGNHTLFER